MLTAPQLFANIKPSGNESCFFCGGKCDTEHTAKEFVKPSFTERDKVRCGASDYVCGGCVATLSDDETVSIIHGEVRFHQKIRNYSWVITTSHQLAATKAHREQLFALCLSPPTPPYAICLADGQKHQLWRTPVCESRDIISVNVEGVTATYSPSQLSDRLAFLKRLVGCTGKPLVAACTPSRMLWTRLTSGMSPEEIQIICTIGDRVRNEPLTKLACWLAPGKDACNDERSDDDTAD